MRLNNGTRKRIVASIRGAVSARFLGPEAIFWHTTDRRQFLLSHHKREGTMTLSVTSGAITDRMGQWEYSQADWEYIANQITRLALAEKPVQPTVRKRSVKSAMVLGPTVAEWRSHLKGGSGE